MEVFVTGATGFVGRNFVEWLTKNQPDARITCLARTPDKAMAQWPTPPVNLRWVAGDLLEPETFESAALEAEQVYHLAALVKLRNGPEFYRMNTETTRKLLAPLATSTRLQRFVFVGSISAIDRPQDKPAVGPLTEDSPPHPNTDYGKSKLMAEALIQTSGLPHTILRPPYIYGPHPRPNSSMDRLIHDVANQRHYTRFPFPGRVSEVYVEDLAEMIWLSGQHPATRNRAFFVGNPQPVRIAQVFEGLSQTLRIPYQPLNVPPERMPHYQRRLSYRHPDNPMLRILFEDAFYCATDQWYQATNYRLGYGYQEGMSRTVAWYRTQGLL